MDGWTFPFVSFIIISRMLKNRGKGSMNETILLIEDNESIIMGLEYLLTEEQYTFLAAKTKKEAQDLLASRQVDLVLLDVSLPDGNGFDLCRKIKEHDIAPVIFLTAKDEEKDVVLGFDLGADDYVTKPFNPLELVARVKSQLRRYTTLSSTPSGDAVYEAGGLVINDELKKVTVDGEEVKLTPIEYNILLLLMKNKGKVFSISQIYEEIWNEEAIGADNTVAVHIRHIREKIEINPKEPRYLKVVWGVGYKIEAGA